VNKSDSGPAAISPDSIAFLADVRKGKPRKFAMICKGTNIVSLVVYKKGSLEKYKKEAKESGKGQFYFGVVDGQGQDIRFALAREDGFEKEPVKPSFLKAFLSESADLKCKPYFEIVDALPAVLDSDDPLVARFLRLQSEALRACDAFPDRAVEINSLCRRIGSALDEDQQQQAESLLGELEQLLIGLRGPDVASGEESDLGSKLLAALKKLQPLLSQAIQQHPSRKQELLDSVARIRDLLRNTQFQEARGEIVALGKLLQSLVRDSGANTGAASESSGETSEESLVDPAVQFASRLKKLKLALDKALALESPGARVLRERVDEMKGLVRSKEYTQANSLLVEVEQLVQRLLETVGSSESGDVSSKTTSSNRVRFAQARLLYDEARKQAQADLQKIVVAARAAFQSEANFEAISRVIDELSSILDGFDERLIDTLDRAYNAASLDDEQALNQDASGLVQEYQNYLQQNEEQLKALDDNPFTPVQIESRLRDTLNNLASQLA
jgi:negative regulator of replication initiation